MMAGLRRRLGRTNEKKRRFGTSFDSDLNFGHVAGAFHHVCAKVEMFTYTESGLHR